jgi:tricorn protease
MQIGWSKLIWRLALGFGRLTAVMFEPGLTLNRPAQSTIRRAAFTTSLLLSLGLLAFGSATILADAPRPVDGRMMRYPNVSSNQIAFTYAGDIWVVPKTGGTATRLSSPRGEELFPRFSPDGTELAFTGDYDGNQDIYVMPVTGGVPRRLTHHGAPDRLLDWYPDGKSLLFATTMTSYKDRFSQLYKVPAEGGLPEKLPMPYGEFGAISPDGTQIAYTPISVDFRTWKRYRGGMNPDIWLFDLEKLTAQNLTKSPASESVPMWHEDLLYFLSDRDQLKRANLWVYEFKGKRFRQVTFFKDYDVHFPSIGPNDIVFEYAGQLYLFDLKTEKSTAVDIKVVTDLATLKPKLENVAGYIQDATISPTGKRALFEARGDIFSVPAEYGIVRNLTRSSGVAERYPAWSPDGKLLAYFSDRTGEYELTVRNADNTGDERVQTKLGAGFRYHPQWSPDSKKILWIDQAMKVYLYDLDTRTNQVIDQEMWMYHGALNGFHVSWSADSRWIAYGGDKDNRNSALVIYDVKQNQRHEVTSGFYDNDGPVFDPDGKYLYFVTGRSFSPTYGSLDNTWIYGNTRQLAVVPLRKEVASPLAPRNDEESDKDKDKEKKKDEEKKPDDKKSDGKKSDEKKDSEKPNGNESKKDDAKPAASSETKKDDAKAPDKKEDKKPKPVEIDFDGFEERVVILPPKAGNYSGLAAVSGKLLYRSAMRGSETTPLEYYDLEKRESKRIVDDADWFELSGNREKLLVRKGGGYSIIDVKEGQNLNKKLATSEFEATIDPQAEWRQIFMDAWRMERDYFYDPHLHGVDWELMRTRYLKLLDDAVTRWDVNFVLGELLGELNSSHTYRNGGDTERALERGVGYLGCDFMLTNGAYRIAKIIDGAPWDSEVRSPLLRPGLTNVHEGDYLLAVNGEALDTSKDPWAAFQGLADKPVMLTVNTNPSMKGAQEVLVQTLGSEARLRNLAWINENRLRAEKLSEGQIGYVYVPDTGQGGQNELVRQWRGQVTKPGLIIDERFNSGGQIPDRFIELLNRPLRNYYAVRDGRDWTWPDVAHFGPKAMLVNGWSGSGGDCFPFLFKEAKLGPVIGMRTWGGLIGITGAPTLVDGGSITVPTFGIYSREGRWIIEGHGVDPDIEVVDDPAAMAKGGDPQLERAVAEVLRSIRLNPPPKVARPIYPNRSN